MRNSSLQPIFAFNTDEERKVQSMLEVLVRSLRVVPGGGKMEEGYWSYIYHTVRNAPTPTWSNLPMRDFCHNGLGVEMKLLQRRFPSGDQGRRLMHPAATRTLLFDPSRDAEICKVQILEQFNAQIRQFRARVAQTNSSTTADIRWGILLWTLSLNEFLYFEEQLREVDSDRFYARFEDRSHRGNPTRNLYIFEKETHIKRYSITMPNKGAKLQPYFDVPLVGEGAYLFQVPNDQRRPIWLEEATIAALERASALSGQNIDEFIRTILSRS
jgi:hypothetical protein